MNKKGGGLGLASGLVKLIGGMVFIWLLVVMWGGGAFIGFAGTRGLVMLGIFLVVLWIITRGKK